MPFNGKDKPEIKRNIVKQPLTIPRGACITAELVDFLDACLAKNPLKRILTKDM